MQALDTLRTADALVLKVSRATLAAIENARTSDKRLVLSLASKPRPEFAPAPAQRGSVVFEPIFGRGQAASSTVGDQVTQRLAKAFGLESDDFARSGGTIRQAEPVVDTIDAAGVPAARQSIGLDQFGVALHELLEAIQEPGGDAAHRLDAALREEAGEGRTAGDATRGRGATFDDIGRYAV